MKSADAVPSGRSQATLKRKGTKEATVAQEHQVAPHREDRLQDQRKGCAEAQDADEKEALSVDDATPDGSLLLEPPECARRKG